MQITRAGTAARWIALAALVAGCAGQAAHAADPAKVLHFASFDIETFDPQQFNDDPSFQIFTAIFEGLYEYDYLASPPQTCARHGGRAAGGYRRRQDVDDPGHAGHLLHRRSGLRRQAPRTGRGGLRLFAEALDRSQSAPRRRGSDVRPARRRARGGRCRRQGRRANSTTTSRSKGCARSTATRCSCASPSPTFPIIHDNLVRGAVAREVVEAAGGDIRTRAVGTGPYKLREWRQGSKVILDANPGYRPIRFPESNDPARAALVRSMKGQDAAPGGRGRHQPDRRGFRAAAGIREGRTRLHRRARRTGDASAW